MKDFDFLLGWLGGDKRIILLHGGARALHSPSGSLLPSVDLLRGSRLTLHESGLAPRTQNSTSHYGGIERGHIPRPTTNFDCDQKIVVNNNNERSKLKLSGASALVLNLKVT